MGQALTREYLMALQAGVGLLIHEPDAKLPDDFYRVLSAEAAKVVLTLE